MDDSPLFNFLVFLFFIIINAVLYAFGDAGRTANEADIEKKASEGNKRAAKIKKLIDEPGKFICTTHLVTCVTVAYIGYSHLGEYASACKGFLVDILGRYLVDELLWTVAYIAVAIYLLILIVSVGIIFPKKLGAKYADGTVRYLVGIVSFIMKLLTPVTAIISLFANLIMFIFGIDPKEEQSNMTEEEIMSVVNEGHELGVLEQREAEMISNIIELDEKTAGDIMVHRKNIIAVDGEMILEDVVGFIVKQKYSRFPVYVGDVDNIVGILHLRNAMCHYHDGRYNDRKVKDIKDILMEAKFIPESKNVDDLFKEMQREKTHMEIVVDEYGQTSGIVAMEDILEEIVGNIMDEYDIEENNIVKENDGSYIVKGMTALEEIEEAFEIKFDSEDYDTLNGYLISKLDRIPSDDEKLELNADGFHYQILSIKDKMIALVKVTKLENVEINED